MWAWLKRMARRLRIGYPKSYRMPADLGSLALDGIAAGLLRGSRVVADQGSVATTGQAANLVYTGAGTGAISVSLAVSNAGSTGVSGAAPLVVYFDAVGTTSSNIPLRVNATQGYTTTAVDEAARRCVFSWDFGDPKAATYTDTYGNTLSNTWTYGNPAYNSKNTEVGGGTAVHVYDTPGTYTVTLTVSDGFTTGVRTQTITVSDPDVVFSGANTICISTDGSTGWGPSGATYQTTAPSWSSLSGKRVLFKRGQNFSALGGINAITGGSNVRVGAYGSGAKPIISTISLGGGRPANTSWLNNWVVSDLNVTGGSASINGFGTNMALIRVDSAGSSGGDCMGMGQDGYYTYSDPFRFVPQSSMVMSTNHFVIECTLPGSYTQNYGIIADVYKGAVIGCYFNKVRFHSFRSGSGYRSILAHNTFDSDSNGDATYHCIKTHGAGNDATGNIPWQLSAAGLTLPTNYGSPAFIVEYWHIHSNIIGGTATAYNWYVAADPQNNDAARGEAIRSHIIENNLFRHGTSWGGASLDIVSCQRELLYVGNTIQGGGTLRVGTNVNGAATPGPSWNGPYYSNRS